MPQLGRYVIDNPNPPGAIEQLGSNMSMLGQLYMKKKMAEQQRQQQLQDAITLEREKAKIGAEYDPLSGLETASKGIESLGVLGNATGDPRFKNMATQIANKYGSKLGGQTPIQTAPQEIGGMQLPQSPQVDVGKATIISSKEPVFGNEDMVTESATTERGMFGDEQVKSRKMFSPEADIIKKRMETKSDIEKSRVVSMSNLETISNAAYDMMNVLNQAIDEGGAGGKIQSFTSGAAEYVGDLPEWMGGKQIGSKFPASGAFEGKKTELLLKMMPMLTQQATKPEGSVRLIESVLKALGKTLPSKGTAKAQAGRMTSESILSFYRFARATQLSNQDFDKLFGNTDLSSLTEEQIDNMAKSWVNSVNQVAGRIEMTGEEKASVEGLINKVISPLGGNNKKMMPVFKGQQQQPQQPTFNNSLNFSSEEEAIRANLKPGTKITINGRPAIWE